MWVKISIFHLLTSLLDPILFNQQKSPLLPNVFFVVTYLNPLPMQLFLPMDLRAKLGERVFNVAFVKHHSAVSPPLICIISIANKLY